jgi:hypothetical protein
MSSNHSTHPNHVVYCTEKEFNDYWKIQHQRHFFSKVLVCYLFGNAPLLSLGLIHRLRILATSAIAKSFLTPAQLPHFIEENSTLTSNRPTSD